MKLYVHEFGFCPYSYTLYYTVWNGMYPSVSICNRCLVAVAKLNSLDLKCPSNLFILFRHLQVLASLTQDWFWTLCLAHEGVFITEDRDFFPKVINSQGIIYIELHFVCDF